MSTLTNLWQLRDRTEVLQRLGQVETWDMLVIGGGITGAGILREAAKRGLKCLLVEQQDFAWGSSSRSSKMVHGGLRYLASGALGLTHAAVQERKRMLAEAPGLVEPLHFLMPHYRGAFPGPKLFAKVLALYDFMAGQQNHEFYPVAQLSRWISGVRPHGLLGATRFGDAITDDARLTLRVLEEARLDGGEALNYVSANSLLREHGRVVGAQLRCDLTQTQWELKAKVVINATGAWSDELRAQLGAEAAIRPLRGSHLLVPFWRLPLAATLSFPHPADQRPVFAFPWLGATVLGTTDLDHAPSLQQEAVISPAEVEYLLAGINHILPTAQLRETDIQATWAGVRPVVAGSASDPSKEKREHVIWTEHGLISVAGGKLTTFRLIALDVLARAARYVANANAPAPKIVFVAATVARPIHMGKQLWRRLKGYYGQRIHTLLQYSQHPIPNTPYLWAEVQWAAAGEAVQHLDDLLLRRTRLGLLLPHGAAALEPALQQHVRPLLGWSEAQWQAEWLRYMHIWQTYYAGVRPS